MSKREPKAGDLVVATVGSACLYSIGDKARLLYTDEDGDWWGDFTMNASCYGDGEWCLGPETDFEVIEDAAPEQLPAKMREEESDIVIRYPVQQAKDLLELLELVPYIPPALGSTHWHLVTGLNSMLNENQETKE